MKQQYDNLQQKLALVEKFEQLFNSQDRNTFGHNLGRKEQEGSFNHAMQGQDSNSLFDGFKFADTDPRSDDVNAAIALLKQILPAGTEGLAELDNQESKNRVFHLFNLAISIMLKPPAIKDGTDAVVTFIADALTTFSGTPVQTPAQANINQLIQHLRSLIKRQKISIQAEIEAVTPKMIAEADAAHKQAQQQQAQGRRRAFRKKALTYTGEAVLFTTGLGLATFSGLMQFSPHLIMQVAAHLPPAALAVLAGLHLTPMILAAMGAVGVGMAGTAAYLAYRTYTGSSAAIAAPATTSEPAPAADPTPVATSSRLAHYVNPALLVSGLSMMSFSALVQFGPKFALLAGLHLSPTALVAIAAVGTLLVSIALCRLCKSYLQARAEAAANKAAEPAATTPVDPAATAPQAETCYQRMVKCIPTCNFRLFGTAAAQPTTTQDLGAANTAQPIQV